MVMSTPVLKHITIKINKYIHLIDQRGGVFKIPPSLTSKTL